MLSVLKQIKCERNNKYRKESKYMDSALKITASINTT